MGELPGVDYYWTCGKCKETFDTASELCDSDSGWYNCCPFCRSVNIEQKFTVEGIDLTFETENEALIAAINLMDGEAV